MGYFLFFGLVYLVKGLLYLALSGWFSRVIETCEEVDAEEDGHQCMPSTLFTLAVCLVIWPLFLTQDPD